MKRFPKMKNLAKLQESLDEQLREECRTNSYLRKLSEAEERRRENVIYGFAPDERLSVEEALEEIRLESVQDSLMTWHGFTNHHKNY